MDQQPNYPMRDMRMSEHSEKIETDVVNMVTGVLNGVASDLNRAGLRAEVQPMRRHGQGPHSSELAVWFWTTQGRRVKDALEFFVLKDGQPVMELGELERWFRESVADVIGKTLSQGTGI